MTSPVPPQKGSKEVILNFDPLLQYVGSRRKKAIPKFVKALFEERKDYSPEGIRGVIEEVAEKKDMQKRGLPPLQKETQGSFIQATVFVMQYLYTHNKKDQLENLHLTAQTHTEERLLAIKALPRKVADLFEKVYKNTYSKEAIQNVYRLMTQYLDSRRELFSSEKKPSEFAQELIKAHMKEVEKEKEFQDYFYPQEESRISE